MDPSKALDPVYFRFTDPDDVALYGDRWYLHDESKLIRMRARDLIALEAEMGIPVVDVMNGARMHTTLGDLAATWMAVRAVDPKLAGPFSDYNPLTLAVTWRHADEMGPDDLGKDEGTPPPPDDPISPDVTSEQTDTVALQTLPIAD